MIQIRLATKDDHQVIADFQIKMALETENLNLDPEEVLTGVLSVIRDPEKGKYFVAATEENKIVSSLLVTFEWSDWRNKWILWIQSVYVSPEYRKQGVFRKMFEQVKQWAEQDPEITGLRLYVDKSNDNAIKVYRQIGMDGEHYQVFEWMIK